MKILWFSNAAWAKTGYGNQTDLFWWRLARMGHEVILGANYGLAGAQVNIQSPDGKYTTQMYPSGFNPHGADIIHQYAERMKVDIAITLYDTWVFNPQAMQTFRWCPWMPVDHEPLPKAVANVMPAAYQPIAYSRFGQRMLQDAGFDALYVPHGIDTDTFTPGDRQEAREKLGLVEKGYEFVAVMVAANKGTPSRKSFNEVLCAWKRFIEDHPKSLLYLHTYSGTEMQGLDLTALAQSLAIPTENLVFAQRYWLMQGYAPTYMNTLYNAADVLLSPSMGEGFGIPIVEAQAAGTPVITGDWTSMPELTFSGWKVGGQRFWTPIGAWQYVPFIDDIYEALCEAYKKRGYDKLRRDARKGAMDYNADHVAETYWKPVLEQIEAEITTADELETVVL